MKYKNLFSVKNKKTIMSSAEFSQRVVKLNSFSILTDTGMVYVEIVPRFTSIFSSQEFNVIEIWRCIQVITIITGTEIGP